MGSHPFSSDRDRSEVETEMSYEELMEEVESRKIGYNERNEPRRREFGNVTYLDYGRRVILEVEDEESIHEISVFKAGKEKIWDVLYRMIEEDQDLWCARRREYSWTTKPRDRYTSDLEDLVDKENELPDCLRRDFVRLFDEVERLDYPVSV